MCLVEDLLDPADLIVPETGISQVAMTQLSPVFWLGVRADHVVQVMHERGRGDQQRIGLALVRELNGFLLDEIDVMPAVERQMVLRGLVQLADRGLQVLDPGVRPLSRSGGGGVAVLTFDMVGPPVGRGQRRVGSEMAAEP